MVSTVNDVAQVLAFLREAYPHEELTRERIAVYVDMLKDIPTPALKAAAREHVATSKWFPTVAELRQPAVALLQTGNEMPDPETAWGIALSHLRHSGPADHPLIDGAMAAIGGWRRIAMSNENDTVAHRAHFVKAYENLLARHNRDMALLPDTREYMAQLTSGERDRAQGAGDAMKRLADGMRRG